jgi:GST-like protein
MTDTTEKKVWTPPAKVEDLFASTAGNQFASTNAPTAGARTTDAVPVGSAPFQFYSLGTPNGQKPAILLEELGIEYDAHKIGLGGDQFKQGFVEINPNSKIPAAVDRVDGKDIKLFESGQ